MYGLINKVLKKMIVDKHGDSFWRNLVEENKSLSQNFNSFAQYDDSITKDIIFALSEKLNISATQLLEEFGQYWIPFAYNSEYSGILSIYEKGPVELLKSLDALHTRLSMSFDNLKPPSFWITSESSNSILVHYQSSRDLPLEYFVVGLIKGIFQKFRKECEIEIIQFRGSGKEAVFKVLHR